MTTPEETTDPVSPDDPLLARLGTGWPRWTYETVMIALALAVIALLTQPDQGLVRTANLVIWAIFVVDYGVRLALARDRLAFIRANIPDLVAIMPLDFFRAARVARVARLTRLLRAGTVLWRASADLRGVLRTSGLQWVLAVAAGSVAVGGTLAWVADPAIPTVGDGIWWAIVTSTTVGYGDVFPVGATARLVAVAVMIVGVRAIGMLTGSIATYCASSRDDHAAGPTNPQVHFVRQRLDDWQHLTQQDRHELAAVLHALAATPTDDPR